MNDVIAKKDMMRINLSVAIVDMVRTHPVVPINDSSLLTFISDTSNYNSSSNSPSSVDDLCPAVNSTEVEEDKYPFNLYCNFESFLNCDILELERRIRLEQGSERFTTWCILLGLHGDSNTWWNHGRTIRRKMGIWDRYSTDRSFLHFVTCSRSLRRCQRSRLCTSSYWTR